MPRTFVFALAALCAFVTSCARNPVTGQQQLSLVSESQEIEIGREASREAVAAIGLVNDRALQDYVQRVGLDLARESERPELPWSFQVLDDPTPNAFALPGGYIFVTRGMLTLMDSEAELAAVLGHEIGHVTARHSVSQISRAQLAQVGLGLGSVLFPQVQRLSGLLGTGLQLMLLQHGRDAERQADELGFTYALNEGYDVREMDDIFQSLDRLSEGSGASPLPRWASTHPPTGERVETIQAMAAQLQGPVETLQVGRAAFMDQIDGLVYGVDPRQGFFRDGVFYHPDLAFRITMPQGWQTQNLPQAVVGVSPNQDAAIQLGVAEGAPEAAARQFLGQSGVQAGQLSSQTINGLPAVVAPFQGQTEQGRIAGLAAFVEHDGQTYAILGYAAAARFSRYESAISGTIGSFARLTDRAILAVNPLRLDIVEVSEPITAQQFLSRYPSDVPAEDVLLINQLGSTSERLGAGSLLKRVIESSGRVTVVDPDA